MFTFPLNIQYVRVGDHSIVFSTSPSLVGSKQLLLCPCENVLVVYGEVESRYIQQ